MLKHTLIIAWPWRDGTKRLWTMKFCKSKQILLVHKPCFCNPIHILCNIAPMVYLELFMIFYALCWDYVKITEHCCLIQRLLFSTKWLRRVWIGFYYKRHTDCQSMSEPSSTVAAIPVGNDDQGNKCES